MEGQSGSTAFTFAVTRGGDTSIATSASWAVTGNGANPAAGSDFAVGSCLGHSKFRGGRAARRSPSTSRATRWWSDEGFTVRCRTRHANTTIGTATAVGTIRNDEASQSILSIAAPSADKAEGQSGTTPFTFTVTRGGTRASRPASPGRWQAAGPIPRRVRNSPGGPCRRDSKLRSRRDLEDDHRQRLGRQGRETE